MNVSKNHHYVPKAILRKFCVSGETILRLDRAKKFSEPEPKNIDRVFQRFHLNNFELEHGQRDDRLERFFAYEFDNFIPEWIDTFARSIEIGHIYFESQQSRFRFIQFFYNHMKRSPDFVDPIVADVTRDVFHDDIAQELESELDRELTSEEISRLNDPKWRKKVIANSRVQSFGKQGENVLNALAEMKIVVAKRDNQKKQFIVASNPVARFENYVGQRLGEPGVELWTPFTPTIAVGFVARSFGSEIISVNADQIRKLNNTLTKNSSAIAGNSNLLLSSLAHSNWWA